MQFFPSHFIRLSQNCKWRLADSLYFKTFICFRKCHRQVKPLLPILRHSILLKTILFKREKERKRWILIKYWLNIQCILNIYPRFFIRIIKGPKIIKILCFAKRSVTITQKYIRPRNPITEEPNPEHFFFLSLKNFALNFSLRFTYILQLVVFKKNNDTPARRTQR